MANEKKRLICIGDGISHSLNSLVRIELHTKTYKVLNQGSKDLRLDTRQDLRARITPGEMVYIEYACRHPGKTDEEMTVDLGLRESTVLAYYIHLGRNFKVRNCSDLRRWAFTNHLVPNPDEEPELDMPEVIVPKEDAPDTGFDPWVRWF